MSTQKNVVLLRHRTEQYRSTMNNMCEAIEDFDEVEKLGQGFSLANPLDEIDIGDGITPTLTFVNVFRAQGYYNKIDERLCRLLHLELP
jgi:hypothetical protein